ncbi:hypothetical protein, partial [Xanthomonas theicola]|uniref:hypothetical protein n=1 Tax=Xanthomonas theicola TaxID=56464 RepID=UPI001B8021A5
QLHRRCPVGLCTIVAGSEGVVQTIPKEQISDDEMRKNFSFTPHLVATSTPQLKQATVHELMQPSARTFDCGMMLDCQINGFTSKVSP